jgi:hypothetical protein
MMNVNLLGNRFLKARTLSPAKPVPQPVPEAHAMTAGAILTKLMAELVRARNASQSALQRLRRDPNPSEAALLELRRTREQVQLRRQTLLRALAAHQKSQLLELVNGQ